MSKRQRGPKKNPSGNRARRSAANRPNRPQPVDDVNASTGAVVAPTMVRRSRRIVRHVDTRSVFKFSVFFYLTLACIALVAGVVLWLAATAMGVRENFEKFIGDLIASNKFHFVGREVLRVSAIAAVVLVILGTAFNLFLAVVYNLIAEIVGGMAIIVDDEQPAPASSAAVSAAPVLPASEITGPRTSQRSHGDGSPVARPAAATPAAPVKPGEDPRAVARWVPKRPQV